MKSSLGWQRAIESKPTLFQRSRVEGQRRDKLLTLVILLKDAPCFTTIFYAGNDSRVVSEAYKPTLPGKTAIPKLDDVSRQNGLYSAARLNSGTILFHFFHIKYQSAK